MIQDIDFVKSRGCQTPFLLAMLLHTDIRQCLNPILGHAQNRVRFVTKQWGVAQAHPLAVWRRVCNCSKSLNFKVKLNISIPYKANNVKFKKSRLLQVNFSAPKTVSMSQQFMAICNDNYEVLGVVLEDISGSVPRFWGIIPCLRHALPTVIVLFITS